MSRILLHVIGVVLLGLLSGTAGAQSSTQPVAPAPPARLLVLPIAPPAAGANQWVARAIRQDLIADLSQVRDIQVIAPPSAVPAMDSESALRAGRDAGADYVVYGQAQLSGQTLRVTGQVLNSSNGRTMAGLKSTSAGDNLFPLEDELAEQVVQALPGHAPPPPAGAPQTPQVAPQSQPGVYTAQETPTTPYEPLAGAPQYPPAGVGQYYSYQQPEPSPSPAYQYPYYYYPYYYPYPYPYYWGYPYYWWYPWGPSVVVVGGVTFHDHDHDHWWHVHDWGHYHYYSPHGFTPHLGSPHMVGPHPYMGGGHFGGPMVHGGAGAGHAGGGHVAGR